MDTFNPNQYYFLENPADGFFYFYDRTTDAPVDATDIPEMYIDRIKEKNVYDSLMEAFWDLKDFERRIRYETDVNKSFQYRLYVTKLKDGLTQAGVQLFDLDREIEWETKYLKQTLKPGSRVTTLWDERINKKRLRDLAEEKERMRKKEQEEKFKKDQEYFKKFYEQFFGSQQQQKPFVQPKPMPKRDVLAEQKIYTRTDWRKWLLKNHPDKGGDTATAQEVTAAGRARGW